MFSTIDLDDETGLLAVKVDDPSIHRMLSAKFRSEKTPAAQLNQSLVSASVGVRRNELTRAFVSLQSSGFLLVNALTPALSQGEREKIH